MKPYAATKDNFLITTDKALLDVDVIHSYLSKESYWAMNVPREVVERSIAGSECFGIYHEQQQIAFARVITDKATFAYLADVFILDTFRGQGLSKWLLEVIHAHPELQGLRRWMLGTRDAHTLYEQFGWTRFGEEQMKRFMHRQDRATY
jgi:GNAT superfamily N-acetyltransferase